VPCLINTGRVILSISTQPKTEINKLISASNPKLVLYNSLIKYANTPPIVLKRQEQRLGKLSKTFEQKMRELRIKTNKLKYYLVSCLLFTSRAKA
jgi:hypothetical protein